MKNSYHAYFIPNWIFFLETDYSFINQLICNYSFYFNCRDKFRPTGSLQYNLQLPPWAGERISPPLPSVSYEATKWGHLRSIDALVTAESVYPRCLPWLEWVSQKLISAVLVLYAVSVMDGHSIMLEKWNNIQNDFGHKRLSMRISQ